MSTIIDRKLIGAIQFAKCRLKFMFKTFDWFPHECHNTTSCFGHL